MAFSLSSFRVPMRGPAQYELSVVVGGHTLRVECRYSELRALHSALMRTTPGVCAHLPPLPPKMPPWTARAPLAAARFPALASFVKALNASAHDVRVSVAERLCGQAFAALALSLIHI